MSPEDIANVIYKLAMDKKKQVELKYKGIERLSAFDDSSQRAKKYLQIIMPQK
jgi:hypothetical protein